MAKRTKIVCTLGPAVDGEPTLRALLEAGMDVARLNFSHGSHDEHRERIERLRAVCGELDSPCAVLLDTRGPEIRTGRLAGGTPVQLVAGDEIVLTEREVDVVRCIASGLTIAESAERLFVSRETVKKHLANIYAKLGVHSKMQAVALLREAGVI